MICKSHNVLHIINIQNIIINYDELLKYLGENSHSKDWCDATVALVKLILKQEGNSEKNKLERRRLLKKSVTLHT